MMKIIPKYVFVVLSMCLCLSIIHAQDNTDSPPSPFSAPDPNRPVGLTAESNAVMDGYILASSVQAPEVILMSNEGQVVHLWESDFFTGSSAYLLDNGNLLRTTSLDNETFNRGGRWGFTNGRIEELTWDGEVVWSFDYASDMVIGHHDIEHLPNGNVLMLVFERYSAEEAITAGRNPDLLPEENEVWGEVVIEVDPSVGEIVWEWHIWDHLIQDFNEESENFGVIAENPEKIDVNYLDTGQPTQPNWWHINAIDYHPEQDLILLSPRTYSEIWMIDHSVTTEEAQGDAGDLLFRWGNPQTYDSGTSADRELYFQHDSQWIRDGYPGAGNILIFDNGGSDRPYSRVIEIALSSINMGDILLESEIVWEYVAETPSDFYSPFISGMQRQANGNTLITDGLGGRLFEVTSAGEIVWEYYFPPAMWIFRAERYDLPIFDSLDVEEASLAMPSGVIWGQDCADGSQPRLHEFIPQEAPNMTLFIDTHGDAAQSEWEMEACLEHGGIAESN